MNNMVVAVLIIFITMHPAFAQESKSLQYVAVAITNDREGIGFDDLVFSSSLKKVIVPGGHTGKIFLIDSNTKEIPAIEGLKVEHGYKDGHGEGTTSADEGSGFIFAIDRSAMLVDIIDPIKKQIISSTTLSSSPDYVRYVRETSEVWVTQPGSELIEIFAFLTQSKPTLSHIGFIDVPGGPESLIIDHVRQLAYTHLWEGQTAAIDLHKHVIEGQWLNGCGGSRGIALDEKRGFLFAGCIEGKAVVMDANKNGIQISSLTTPPGVDVIGYNSKLTHLYLASRTLSVIGVSEQGKLSLLGTGKAAEGSHCVTGDDQGNIWVCDPRHGKLLLYKDEYAP